MKSEADIVEVTVMKVFREEKSVRRVRAGSKSVSDRLLILWQEFPKSTTFRIITCTGSKSTPCIILNIVYNLLNNIVHYIYINFLYLINNHLVFYMWGFIGVKYFCYITNSLSIEMPEYRVYQPLPTHPTIFNSR